MPANRTPHFEPLEPRLLLNADLIEPVPLSPPEAPLGGDDIYVDLSQQDDEAQGPQALELFSTSPALFVENQGQWADSSVRYVHDGDSVDVAVLDSGLWFQATRQDPSQPEDSTGPAGSEQGSLGAQDTETQVLQFSTSFVGADLVQPMGLEPSESLFNYYIGDPADWRQNVPSYEIVACEGLYEGIDLHIQGLRSHLKYEFHVAPGADFSQIAVRYEGIEGLSIAEDGSLEVDLAGQWGVIRDDAPYIYQEINGRKVEVAGRFILLDDRTYSFEITGGIDPDHVLVIDPDLAWSTYLGGSEYDVSKGIAVDGSGGVYVTGDTDSTGWVSGGFDTAHNGMRDVFVAKLSSSGAHLWSTYLGGSGPDNIAIYHGIAMDASGNVYVAGYTGSAGWTSGGFDTTYNDGGDAFVAKLSSSGAHLWSTYLGGNDLDEGCGIAVDASGSVYVDGLTRSAGWTSGGFDTTFDGGWQDAFVVKLSSSGLHLWSTYLGGNAMEGWINMAVDGSGVYVTGYTASSGWTSGGFDTTYNGGDSNGFVAKLSVDGAHLWSTYLLGGGAVYGVATDVSGNVYVSGGTVSAGWTSGGFDTTYNGGSDGYVVKLSSSGLHLWSTYLGGSGNDGCCTLGVDASGSVCVIGETNSYGWTSGGFDTIYNGRGDAFAAKLSSSGAHLWSTYLGGSESEHIYNTYGSAVDASGNVYVTGRTLSAGWTSGGFDTTYNGNCDVFAAKLSSSGTHLWSTYLGGSQPDGWYVAAIAVDASGNVYVMGDTDSSGWTSGGFDTTYNGGGDAFVAKITDSDTVPPSPNPSTWATEPYAASATSIQMVATVASDPSGVEYYFDETSGNPDGTDSGWQDSNTYEDTGLSASTAYTYQAKTRDKSANHNETDYSSSRSATTQALGIVASPSAVSVPEGSMGTFRVKLSAQPASDVTVTVSRADGDTDIVVSAGSSLIFTSSNWDTYQTVTLSAMEDADATSSTATIRCSASGLSDKDVMAVELDNDSSLGPVYRFWSPVHSRHFYTIDDTERDKLINQYSHVWTYEGPAYQAYADDTQPDVAPIYRFWSGTLNAHFYTIDQAERDKLVNQYSHVWTYEGVAFYAYADGSQPVGTYAVYRFWSSTLNCHFFTMDPAERDKLINLYPHVWTYEQIAWYAYGV